MYSILTSIHLNTGSICLSIDHRPLKSPVSQHWNHCYSPGRLHVKRSPAILAIHASSLSKALTILFSLITIKQKASKQAPTRGMFVVLLVTFGNLKKKKIYIYIYISVIYIFIYLNKKGSHLLVTATWRLDFPSSITSMTSSGLDTNRSVHPYRGERRRGEERGERARYAKNSSLIHHVYI